MSNEANEDENVSYDVENLGEQTGEETPGLRSVSDAETDVAARSTGFEEALAGMDDEDEVLDVVDTESDDDDVRWDAKQCKAWYEHQEGP